jgi:GNAT superfamily N-acetyltransferase
MSFRALDKPNTKEICAAIEGNLIAKVKHYPSLLPEMTVLEEGDVDVINSNEKTSTFNIICNARFLEPRSQKKVRDLSEYYQSRDLPVCWWLGPSTTPSALGDVLRAEGWQYEATDLGLAADLRKLSFESDEIKDINIKQVKDVQTMMDFAGVLASFFGASEKEAILSFYRKVAQRGFTNKDPLQNFVAYWNGKPVATSSYFLSHGVAGFYDCLTLAEMRRKGIGQAMMRKRFKQVLELGIPWVTLSSSHDSRGLYQKLGFQQYCEFSTFVKA